MILRHGTLFTTVTPVLCMVLRKQRYSIDKIINETMHANAKVGKALYIQRTMTDQKS